MTMPLNQQIGRFLRKYAPSKGMWLTTEQAYRAHDRYLRISAVAELFYSERDQNKDDMQREIDALTDEDYADYECGRRYSTQSNQD